MRIEVEICSYDLRTRCTRFLSSLEWEGRMDRRRFRTILREMAFQQEYYNDTDQMFCTVWSWSDSGECAIVMTISTELDVDGSRSDLLFNVADDQHMNPSSWYCPRFNMAS